MQRLEHQLDADEAEHDREADREVDQPVEQVAEQEVELAQAEQGEHVRGEDDVRLLVRPKIAGIESRANSRSVVPSDSSTTSIGVHSRLAVDEVRSLVPWKSGVVGRTRAHPADDGVLAVLVVVGLALGGELDRGEDEERAEDVEDPGVALDDRRAEGDEDRPQDQRDEDAAHEHRLLQLPRHVEAGHDQQEHEQVVDREAVLGDPAGEELHRVLATGPAPHREAEGDGEADVEAEPAEALGRASGCADAVRRPAGR